MNKLTLDYETRSQAELKKVGSYEYARHPSTEIICVGYKFNNEETKIWKCFEEACPSDLYSYFLDPNISLRAHNAFFEQVITKFVLPKYIDDLPELPPERWTCTAAKAAAHALPRNLEGACLALGLKNQKGTDGRKLINKYCKPRPTWLRRGTGPVFSWDQEGMEKMYLYCMKDVEAEFELDEALPDLIPIERKLWLLDQKINHRGIFVDVGAVRRILGFIEEESKILYDEFDEITLGLVGKPTQRNELLKWLESEGIALPNLRAKTVEEYLKNGELSGDHERILEIRKAVSKTSTAKYQAFILRSATDQRVRDLMLFCGANTRRWAGVGLQPHNFPKGIIEDTDKAIELILNSDLETLRLIYGDPMALFSSTLRGMITASPGCELFCADFASIEARVLFWMAGHHDGIAAFHEGRPIYEEMAAHIFNVNFVENVTKAQRFVGKETVLGSGFGMGVKKFMETLLAKGIDCTEELAKAAIYGYREKHAPVPRMWYNLEKAAILAVKNPGRAFKVNKTRWRMRNKFLICDLPSGGFLAYYDPKIEMKKTPWGEMMPGLTYMRVHPQTKKWGKMQTWGGKLTENVVQATARDVMAESMLRVEDAGFRIGISVHDEILSEREIGTGDVQEYKELMETLPTWAEGLPNKVEAWKGFRYKK